MEAFIEQYGYAFVVLGTLFGGETVLAMAGFAAHRGYLLLPYVVAAGCVGNFAENQIWFFVGRHYGSMMLARYPSWKPRLVKVHSWLERHRVAAVIGIRFLAGLRTPGALAIGISDIPLLRFMVLNLMGALVWAIVFAISGYFFGIALQALLGDLKDVELYLVASIAFVGIAGWLYFRIRHRAVRK